MRTRSCPLFALLVGLSAVGFLGAVAGAEETVPLIAAGDALAGWTFDNGREFPGATGRLTVDPGPGGKAATASSSSATSARGAITSRPGGKSTRSTSASYRCGCATPTPTGSPFG